MVHYVHKTEIVIAAQIAFSSRAQRKHTHTHTHVYTGRHRRNVPDFGRVFLMLKYTDITQNAYVQS